MHQASPRRWLSPFPPPRSLSLDQEAQGVYQCAYGQGARRRRYVEGPDRHRERDGGNLTSQVRNIALVTTAVANGDLSQKITVEAQGEMLELKNTINTMVDQLNAFASEVTRVAREVGTEGMLGGQANVPGVAGTWKDLTDNVNFMAANLTSQVRNIAARDDGGRQRRPVAEDHRRSAAARCSS